jgi:hypothetical protein
MNRDADGSLPWQLYFTVALNGRSRGRPFLFYIGGSPFL